ncbi:MAG: anaerobic ribonucleoside-triphosphate reductase activating protein [Eubacterium sp.]|nr:anaerobic ribonucleoside-triphosphate reductase activating protein [Eubacterium sp.]
MNYGAIKDCDIANGVGVRISLFVSGCTHCCEDCFQPETWDFAYGDEFTDETMDKIINMLSKDYIDGLTILGGEPMEPENQGKVLELILRVREELPEKNIWIYSGYQLDADMLNGKLAECLTTRQILEQIDVLVDGEFEKDKKNIRLKFRGSENQRIIDVQKSLATEQIVLIPELMKMR